MRAQVLRHRHQGCETRGIPAAWPPCSELYLFVRSRHDNDCRTAIDDIVVRVQPHQLERSIGALDSGIWRWRVNCLWVAGSSRPVVLQAILITLIGLCESVSIAKTVALRYKYDIDANQVSVYQRQPLPWLQHCACTQ